MIVDIVVPCFNEEAVVEVAGDVFIRKLDQLVMSGLIAKESSILFIDDGSYDNTWNLIKAIVNRNPGQVKGIKLSGNKGHQNAVLAGLNTSIADAVISIDADLQDDVNAIDRMIAAHLSGAEIVFGVRSCRASDTLFKRFTAESYYRFLALCGMETVFNHADYRLLGRRAIEALKEYSEVNLFLRGLVTKLGFKSQIVEYVRVERIAGESKYPLRKMLSLAWDGITSFSTMPIRWITFCGFSVALIALLSGLWVIWVVLIQKNVVPGWASVALPMFFLGGIQLIALGVIGEYIGKIYMETKRRPRYVIEEII